MVLRIKVLVMSDQIPLTIQTVYAELVERAHLSRMVSDFDPGGEFQKKTVKGRDYWYFRSPMQRGERKWRYVGPDSPQMQTRIARHHSEKDGYKQRRMMVSALLQPRTGLRGPDPRTGRVLEALSDAGVFRMRAVVVGTAAYQTYAGLLGVKLANTNAMTDDLDVAQFETISIAVEDSIDVPFLEVLRKVDPGFEPIMATFAPGKTCRYALGDTYRVDLLTPNRGPDTETPVMLPALQTEAQPLRFLDFLIYQEVQAVALYGAGIAINVPAPERYALHKLLVSRLRIHTADSQAKARKDLRQAGELLAVLCDHRPYEIRDLWEELTQRGPKWREKVSEAVSMLDVATGSTTAREKLESIVGETVPGGAYRVITDP
jgi:hypothetical protein